MDFKKLFRKDDKAVSPVIGVILMVAITVILAAAIGSSVFSHGTAQSAPQANFDIKAVSPSVTTGTVADAVIKIEHLGGDTIHFKDKAKLTATGSDGKSVEIDATGLGDFSAGDVQTLSLTAVTGSTSPIVNSGNTINIKIIDKETNQLICDKNVRF